MSDTYNKYRKLAKNRRKKHTKKEKSGFLSLKFRFYVCCVIFVFSVIFFNINNNYVESTKQTLKMVIGENVEIDIIKSGIEEIKQKILSQDKDEEETEIDDSQTETEATKQDIKN